ncbi:hypothetical protein [Psychrobacter sp. L7]|uniref:hypothetical protein n=1 Tax=Psychrobacter sp. L7 TaxID=1982756 RepID=UPI001561E3A2|nr:hypothetical protein [Psychrobacter sp. L7]
MTKHKDNKHKDNKHKDHKQTTKKWLALGLTAAALLLIPRRSSRQSATRCHEGCADHS